MFVFCVNTYLDDRNHIRGPRVCVSVWWSHCRATKICSQQTSIANDQWWASFITNTTTATRRAKLSLRIYIYKHFTCECTRASDQQFGRVVADRYWKVQIYSELLNAHARAFVVGCGNIRWGDTTGIPAWTRDGVGARASIWYSMRCDVRVDCAQSRMHLARCAESVLYECVFRVSWFL